MTDEQFLAHIIGEICDYSINHEMQPDDTLSAIADDIKAVLKISTFNNWKRR